MEFHKIKSKVSKWLGPSTDINNYAHDIEGNSKIYPKLTIISLEQRPGIHNSIK